MPFRGMDVDGEHRFLGITQALTGPFFDKNTDIASADTPLDWDHFISQKIAQEDRPIDNFSYYSHEMLMKNPEQRPVVWTKLWSMDVYGFKDRTASVEEGVACLRAISKVANVIKLTST